MVQRGDNISRPKLETSFVFVPRSVLQRLFLFVIFLRDSVVESIVFQTYRNGYRSWREYTFYLYKDVKIVARFRYENEELGSKYWEAGRSKRCGSCETECERLERVARRCNEVEKADEDLKRMLDESGEGYPWMRELLKKRDRKR